MRGPVLFRGGPPRHDAPVYTRPLRRAVNGADALSAALAAGEPLAAVFVTKAALGEDAAAIAAARRAGVAVHVVGATVLARFGRGEPRPRVLGVAGPPPRATLAELLARRGAGWLLAGVAYPTNAGSAIRTAEVSGADGVIVDAAFSAADRRTALRASMRADRVMPVLFERAEKALDAARSAGTRVVGVEDSGRCAPWDADLARPSLFVLGGERDGIPADSLARCDEVVRVPMAGFIPSYNVQAAMAAVAAERLRQLAR
jgi:tRNA G18 (ribose-2'-O)-methylase SpoU